MAGHESADAKPGRSVERWQVWSLICFCVLVLLPVSYKILGPPSLALLTWESWLKTNTSRSERGEAQGEGKKPALSAMLSHI
ncbi:hypothetical protein CapIbe_002671 [Capra ibex]